MGWSLRPCLVDATGRMKRLPLTRFERLWRGDRVERFPACAGQYLRVALACVEFLDRRPVRLERIDLMSFKLDDAGRIDATAHERLRHLLVRSVQSPLDHSFRPEGSVAYAAPRFLRRQLDAEFSWRPTVDQRNQIIRLAMRRPVSRSRA